MNSSRVIRQSTLFLCLTFAITAHASLTLEHAWKQVKNCNPALQASASNIAAIQGQQVQASLIPNPSVDIIVGDVPGLGYYSNNQNAQSTYMINQPIELGGKRGARKEVAKTQFQASQVAYQANSASLFRATVQAFLMAAEAEAKLDLTKRAVSINQQTVSTIENRINAGRASELDLSAAQIALNDQKLALASAENELLNTQFSLARLWGGSTNEANQTLAPSIKKMPLSPLPYYLRHTKQNIELQFLTEAEKVAKAQIHLAKSNKYPDVTVGAGIEHFRSNGNAAVIAVSMPIPLFDRNQGNEMSAAANYNKTLADSENKERLLQSEIVKIYQTAKQAQLQIYTLRKSILPQSKHALTLAKQGYEQGRFSYLDLLNAQQKLVDAQMREVTAIFLYSKAWYDLQILTGALPRQG